MKLSAEERKMIKSWYEYISRDSQHYGNGAVLFTNEGILLNKINAATDETEFSDYDQDLIRDWMISNIKRKYGDSKVLLGAEQTLYEKLK